MMWIRRRHDRFSRGGVEFEVPTGGRRYRAIERLVKAKRFPKDGLVPCIVRDPSTKILAEDDSLANVHRVALHEPANRYNQGRVSAQGARTRLDQADVLARAVGLDMVQVGWRPTVDNYLRRVTKPRILDAVREAKGESSAQLIDH
jgi:hypothetical protein